MSVRIMIGDVRDKLRELPDECIDCVVTSPPYWGLRDYGVAGQLGMERTLGEHIDTLVDVFSEMRRVIKPQAAFWLNYGDCYATSPNGRSAAKPFSTVGPIYDPNHRARGARGNNLDARAQAAAPTGRVVAGGTLKPKDLCLIPFRLAIALQEDGWWIRSRCIWGKPNGMPDSSGRYRPSVAHEEVFLLGKTGDIWYDSEAVKSPPAPSSIPRWNNTHDGQGSSRANGGTRTDRPMRAVGGPLKKNKQRGHSRRHQGFNDRWDQMTKDAKQDNGRLRRTYEPELWHIANAAFGDAHFATFPPALVERCLTASCPPDGTVLDPFGGAGTVGLVADRMGFDAILIELNPAYAEIAERRIKDDAGMFGQVSAAP